MEAWANALILIMLSVGHAELWITLINRTHSYPIHEPILKRIRHVHDVLIVSFPLILFLTVGLYTPGVFAGRGMERTSFTVDTCFLVVWVGLSGICVFCTKESSVQNTPATN